MSKTIADLRDRLFTALDGLADKTLEIERAEAIADMAQTIINSAKVEVDHMKIVGARANNFLTGSALPQLPAPAGESADTVEKGKGYTVRQHRLK